MPSGATATGDTCLTHILDPNRVLSAGGTGAHVLQSRLSTPGAFSKSWTMSSLEFAGESSAPEPDTEPAPEPHTKRELFMTAAEVASKKARPSQPPPASSLALQASPQRVFLTTPGPSAASVRPPTSLQHQPVAQLLAMPVQHSIPVLKLTTLPQPGSVVAMQAPAAALPAHPLVPPALVHRVIPQARAMPPPNMHASIPAQKHATPETTIGTLPPVLAAQGMLQQAAAAMSPAQSCSPQPVKMELVATPKTSPGRVMLRPFAAKTPSMASCPTTPKASPVPSTFKPKVPPLPGSSRPLPTPVRTAAAPTCKQEFHVLAAPQVLFRPSARPVALHGHATAHTAALAANTGHTMAAWAPAPPAHPGQQTVTPAAHSGHPTVTPTAHTGQPEATHTAHVGQPAVTPAAHSGQPTVTPAAHSGQPQATHTAHSAQPAATPAAHSGQPASAQPAATRPAHTGQPTVTHTAHPGQAMATPAAHSGQPPVTPSAHTGQPTVTPAAHTGQPTSTHPAHTRNSTANTADTVEITDRLAITDGREIVASPTPKAGILRHVTWADQNTMATAKAVPPKAVAPCARPPPAAPAASAPPPVPASLPKTSPAAAKAKTSSPVPATNGNHELLQEAEQIQVNTNGAATSLHFLETFRPPRDVPCLSKDSLEPENYKEREKYYAQFRRHLCYVYVYMHAVYIYI